MRIRLLKLKRILTLQPVELLNKNIEINTLINIVHYKENFIKIKRVMMNGRKNIMREVKLIMLNIEKRK